MRTVVLLLVFTFFFSRLQAQLTANFTVSKSNGCSPLLVQFTNTTSGASANATYRWDFGNGNTSTLKNAGAIYREEKVYTVTLTVKDGSQTATKSATVTVNRKPAVDFTASVQKGCMPLNVLFTANATAGDGNVISYDWDFGDGATRNSSANSVQHTYNAVQKAGISLTVTNSYGCYETVSKENFVEIKEALKAEFSADKQVLCRESDPVQFTNTSSGPGMLSYVWDFGDGSTATAKEPSHVFNKKGNYSVKLTVNSSEGCSAVQTQTNYLNVANFKTDFEVPNPLCKMAGIVFNNTSLPAPANRVWEVDGQPVYSYTAALYYTFFTAGEHTVKLKNTFGTCPDSVTKKVLVKEPPVVTGFVADIGGKCGAPVQVQFKDTTPGAVSWKWYFDSYFNVQSTQ